MAYVSIYAASKVQNLPAKTIFTNLDAIITGATLTICVILVNANVVMRYFFNSPIKWVEEVTNLMLIWMGFLAICYATAHNSQVSIDFITKLLPRKVFCIWTAVLQLIVCVTFMLLLGPAIDAIQYQITTPALNLSLKVLFTIIPGSCILITVHAIVNILDLMTEVFRKETK